MSDVMPMLDYEDGPAAMDWLAEAFGFVEVTRWLNDEGNLAHGEMRAGNGSILLANPSPHYQSPKRHREQCEAARAWMAAPWVIDGVLVYVDDVAAHFARAQRAGARMLSGLEESVPGKLYRTEDLEGHRWMFVQRRRAPQG